MPTTTEKTNETKIAPIPAGHSALAPYLQVRGAEKAMDFYAKAFGARELFHLKGQDGRVMHAEMRIGDAILMLSDVPPAGPGSPQPPAPGAARLNSILFYTEDVDGTFAKASAAGATVLMPPTDMFWGDRFGKLLDPFGHEWGVATHKEDVTPEEMQRRMACA